MAHECLMRKHWTVLVWGEGRRFSAASYVASVSIVHAPVADSVYNTTVFLLPNHFLSLKSRTYSIYTYMAIVFTG